MWASIALHGSGEWKEIVRINVHRQKEKDGYKTKSIAPKGGQ